MAVIVPVHALARMDLLAGARVEARGEKGTWTAVVERLAYHHVILASLAGSDVGSD